VTMRLRLVSVNVGLPKRLGELHGEPVISGIVKTPVAQDTIRVGLTNIEGDGQADLSVHGGIDKAVYCYPTDHWPWWESEHSFPCRPAAFGENLTIEGADETMVAIGDRFRWGEVLLEVSQPRAPCFKFAMMSGRDDAPALMTLSGRSGWYFRVLQSGTAPVRDGKLERDAGSGGPSVRDAFVAALHPRSPTELRERVLAAPALSTAWRHDLARKTP